MTKDELIWAMVYAGVVSIRFHPRNVPELGKLSRDQVLHEVWECVNIADRALEVVCSAPSSVESVE